MMTAGDVIESYVTDVATQLPRKQRNDVAFELRALLNEELQGKAEATGRTADAAMATEFLRAFGRPRDVAARYRPTLTIIDPADGHSFLRATVIGLAILWCVGLWIALRQPIDSGSDLLLALGQWWGTTVIPSLWWPGMLVVGYGAASWARRRRPQTSEWKPLAGDRIRGGRAAMAMGLAGILCGLFVLLDPRWVLDFFWDGRAAPAAYEALTYTDTFLRRQAPVLLVLLLLNIPLLIAVIVRGRWSAFLRRLEMGLVLATSAAMVWTVVEGPIFLAPSADRTAKFFMLLIVVFSLIAIGIELYRSVRPAPMLRTLCLLSIVTMAGVVPAQAQTEGQAPSAPSQPPTVPAAFVKPEAPGRLIDVGGRRLHILCKGAAAGPTVIFEAGLSQYTANTTYGTAQDAIAPFARVCTYDRAGLGWSDPAPQGWTQAGMAADLHALLAAAGEPRPYVIVAHSMGGLVARTYIRTFRNDVAGLILLDATSDEDFEELAAGRAVIMPQLDAAIGSSRPGIPVVGMPAGTSPEVVMAFTPEILRGVKTEFEALDRLPAEMKRPGGFGDLGDLPLIVVRRGKTEQPPSEADLRHQRVQENLAKLSKKSTLIVAQNSGHTIPLDEPGAVTDAVRRMLDGLKD